MQRKLGASSLGSTVGSLLGSAFLLLLVCAPALCQEALPPIDAMPGIKLGPIQLTNLTYTPKEDEVVPPGLNFGKGAKVKNLLLHIEREGIRFSYFELEASGGNFFYGRQGSPVLAGRIRELKIEGWRSLVQGKPAAELLIEEPGKFHLVLEPSAVALPLYWGGKVQLVRQGDAPQEITIENISTVRLKGDISKGIGVLSFMAQPIIVEDAKIQFSYLPGPMHIDLVSSTAEKLQGAVFNVQLSDLTIHLIAAYFRADFTTRPLPVSGMFAGDRYNAAFRQSSVSDLTAAFAERRLTVTVTGLSSQIDVVEWQDSSPLPTVLRGELRADRATGSTGMSQSAAVLNDVQASGLRFRPRWATDWISESKDLSPVAAKYFEAKQLMTPASRQANEIQTAQGALSLLIDPNFQLRIPAQAITAVLAASLKSFSSPLQSEVTISQQEILHCVTAPDAFKGLLSRNPLQAILAYSFSVNSTSLDLRPNLLLLRMRDLQVDASISALKFRTALDQAIGAVEQMFSGPPETLTVHSPLPLSLSATVSTDRHQSATRSVTKKNARLEFLILQNALLADRDGLYILGVMGQK